MGFILHSTLLRKKEFPRSQCIRGKAVRDKRMKRKAPASLQIENYVHDSIEMGAEDTECF
jgi:hypothetical protein